MKCRAYIRVAKTRRNPGFKVEANAEPTEQPLTINGTPVPTAAFALDFDIPESRFKMAEQVLAEIKIMESTELKMVDVVYVGDVPNG